MILFLLCGCVNAEDLKTLDYTDYPDYLITAEKYVEMHEIKHRKELTYFMNVDPIQYEWCAAFVNGVLSAHNIPGSESVSEHPLMARSFLKWGKEVSEPKLGDIVILKRGNNNWQGHVGIFILSHNLIDGQETYVLLGGNQDDKVGYNEYPKSRVIGIRRY